MSDDMAIIKQIEKQIGKELKIVPIEEIWRENGYALDKKTGQMTGLNLDGREIKDISFISGLRGLTHLYLSGNQLTVHNILYFDPRLAVYYRQGRSYRWGIKLYFENIS